MPTPIRTVDFGPRQSGLATVGYRLGAAPRATAGVSELLPGSGIYGVALADPASPTWILWDTGGASPRYAAEDLDAEGSPAVHRSADFGPRRSGLATVGYTLSGVPRTTSGVSELLAGTGIYGAFVTPPSGYEGPITWDTGEASPAYAEDSIDLAGAAPAPTGLFESALASRIAGLPLVRSLAGSRVFPSRRPQRKQLPCLTYKVISKPRDADLDGPAGIAHARVQVSAWAHAYGTAKVLADAVRRGVPVGTRGDLGGGVVVTGTWHSDERDLAEAPADGTDDWTHQITFDLRMTYRE